MPKVDQVIPILNVATCRPASRSTPASSASRSLGTADAHHLGGVRSGDQEIRFCQGSQRHPGAWLAIWVEDVDALYERYSASRVDIRQGPTTFEWGVCEMNVADPDSHRIRFSTATDAPADGVDFPRD